MTGRVEPYNILFLCTGNSARSILAEAIANEIGGERFKAFSAGSFPKGRVNPHALALLEKLGHPVERLRSKSWDEFAGEQNQDAPHLDFIVTVCDYAAGEVCPIWPGHPMTAHWGLSDPADAEGSDAQIAAAFEDTYCRLKSRIEAFVRLPIGTLDRPALLQQMRAIGELKLAPVAMDSPLFAAFKRHLANAGLPTEDLQAEPSSYYALEPDGNDARAFGGLVSLGNDALLRSVVVPTEERGRGYGNVIVRRISEGAAKSGAKNLWLLTTSADGFFEKQGWRTVKREDAPVSVTSTRQFSLICPNSAVLMCRAME